jgi:hypothetical protein
MALFYDLRTLSPLGLSLGTYFEELVTHGRGACLFGVTHAAWKGFFILILSFDGICYIEYHMCHKLLLKLSKLLLKLCGIKWCYLANMRLVRGK